MRQDTPPTPSAEDVSVVVIAHGRHAHLRRMLAALQDSAARPREVVVVAMGDPAIARLPEVARGHGGTRPDAGDGMGGSGAPAGIGVHGALSDGNAPDGAEGGHVVPVRTVPVPAVPVRVVPLDADPGRLPLARARNAGALAATGRYLVFLDVDCLADPELVGRYAGALGRLVGERSILDGATFRRDTSGGRTSDGRTSGSRTSEGGRSDAPVVCAGPVTYLPPGVPLGAPGDPVDWAALRAQRAPHRARPDPAVGELVRGTDLDLFWSLSFGVSRADYAACGGFDEAYEGYGGEDTDFARRLRAAGGSLWWVGGADAYHQHHPVSRPPVEHVAAIVRNVGLFRERWGEDCMSGWLAAFADNGLVQRGPDGSWRLSAPSADPSGGGGGPVHVVPGPERHGVTRHALALVAAGGQTPLRLPAQDPAAVAAALAALPDGAGVHLHLTDGLLPDAPRVVNELAARRRVSLTLHDIPTPAEGADRYARRAAAYAAITRAAALVVVASAHERDLLARCVEVTGESRAVHAAEHATRHAAGHAAEPQPPRRSHPPVQVVPLPIERPYAGPRPAPDPVVGVLGYLYPGKGHAEAIEAAAAAGLRGVVALGAVAAGHAALADELARAAAAVGLTWDVTGFLADVELADRARRVAVPLAAHAHVSASGSIGTWIECGRRPLVADGGWVRELAARCPGSVTVLRDLRRDVAAAAASPALTWVDASLPVGPTTEEAWRALAALLAQTHGVAHAWPGAEHA